MKDEKDKTASFFVSRRGKQVGVHQVDLTGIDIDSDDTQKPDTAKPVIAKKNKPQKKPKQPSSRAPWSRKKAVIVGVVVFIVLLPVVFAEFVVSQYKGGVTSAKQDFSKLVDASVKPAQKKPTISADQIRDITNKLNDTVGDMCRGGLLDNAASLYPRAKDALDGCHEQQEKYAALVSSLYALEADARYLEKLEAVMKPVATPITDEYAVLDAQHTAWRQSADGLKKLSPTDRMRVPHEALVKHTEVVVEAWSKLNTANNNQDAASFEASEKALTTGYEAVRSTGDVFTKALAATQAKVTADYEVLK